MRDDGYMGVQAVIARQRTVRGKVDMIDSANSKDVTCESVLGTHLVNAALADSALYSPTRAVVCKTCRCRLDASTVSKSNIPIVPVAHPGTREGERTERKLELRLVRED
jgi:hypothetical protein